MQTLTNGICPECGRDYNHFEDGINHCTAEDCPAHVATKGPTQGIWFVDKGDSAEEYLLRADVDGENFDLASFACDETGNIEANARLLQAAPAMLKALQHLTELYLQDGGSNYLNACLSTPSGIVLPWKEAQQAISKAIIK